MRNKRFPSYPDDTDYNTNSNSYYDDLARKQKLIQLLAEKIWEYDERLDERLDDLHQVLSSYLAQWDDRIENLDDEVSQLFNTWLNDGTLEQIINNDVLGNKADKSFVDSEIERLEQKDANLTNHVDAEIERLEQKDTNLTNRVNSEINRLDQKDTNLNNHVDSEIERLDQKDENLIDQLAQTEQEFEKKVAFLESGKVDKNGSMQVNYGNLAQDVREKLTGDQVAIVGAESTGQANLTQNAVSEFETSIIEKSKNLFNPNNVVRGYTLNPNTGAYIEETYTTSTKDWIRVAPGETLYRNFRATWMFADESFNIIGGQGAVQEEGIIEIPSNAYFIKVSSKNKSAENAQLEYGTSETSLVSGEFRFKEGIKFSGHDLDRESVPFDKLTGFVTSSNLLDDKKMVPNVYVRTGDGHLMGNASNSAFEDIPIPAGTEVLRVHEFTGGNVNYVLKNRAGTRVVGATIFKEDADKTIPIPETAVSLTISFANTELYRAMVSVGSEEKPYEPYYKYFEEIVEPPNNLNKNRLGGKVGVAFGDSLTGMYADHLSYPDAVKDKLGLEEYINVGFNGTRMSGAGSEHYQSFSLVALVDAVISNDFTRQEDMISGVTVTDMYEPHLNNLKNIDWLAVDFVSIFYGANDYNGNVALDNETDIYDTTTFNGGLRYAIKELSTKYPHLKFVIITPSYVRGRENNENSAGLLTDDYVQGAIDVQKELSTALVNLFHNGQINRFNYDTFMRPDGIHFNTGEGMERVSELVSSQLLAQL